MPLHTYHSDGGFCANNGERRYDLALGEYTQFKQDEHSLHNRHCEVEHLGRCTACKNEPFGEGIVILKLYLL